MVTAKGGGEKPRFGIPERAPSNPSVACPFKDAWWCYTCPDRGNIPPLGVNRYHVVLKGYRLKESSCFSNMFTVSPVLERQLSFGIKAVCWTPSEAPTAAVPAEASPPRTA